MKDMKVISGEAPSRLIFLNHDAWLVCRLNEWFKKRVGTQYRNSEGPGKGNELPRLDVAVFKHSLLDYDPHHLEDVQSF